jgi:hypothetical protein
MNAFKTPNYVEVIDLTFMMQAGKQMEIQSKNHPCEENLDIYLPCSKIQFCVANLVHFKRDIKILQNSD